MLRRTSILLIPLLYTPTVEAQLDTVKLRWPNPPFAASHAINGTFCEYRNTLSANHFHNGVDIGEPDNNPIYPCLNGVVYSLSTTSGSNNFVRVKTNVAGVWKHISYVHINPNPALSVGSPVIAGETVLGTIYPDMGHVHLTERELVTSENGTGVEINALRSGGGLTPYDDPYTPVINRSTLQFRQHETGSAIPGSVLYGNIDIIIRVDERNGPGSAGSTQTNNGTYMIGYRILVGDSVTVAYEPPDNGLRYRFDRKPADADVDIAFLAAPVSTTSSHHYRVTAGSGAAAVNSTLRVSRNAFNTEQLSEGSYILEIFTEDTRGNTDRALFPISITRRDLVPPAPPTLKTVAVDTMGRVALAWHPAAEADLKGYRLYYSLPGAATWHLALAESVLTKSVASHLLEPPFPFAESPTAPYTGLAFRLTAVDTVSPPNESAPSDVYFAGWHRWSSPTELPTSSALIVDGFDRYKGNDASASWGDPAHPFVRLNGELLPFAVAVSSCANEAVEDASVSLRDYDMVIWILGDESTIHRTFTSAEQLRVREFLENGGRLFVSGSEIGWDLGRSHSRSEPGDLGFYNNYLKAAYVYDGDSNMRTATGTASSPFSGLTFTFGQTYPEDYPDDINPVNGSVTLLTYNTSRGDGSPRIAGISYAGTFGSSSTLGKLVYLSFPFETIGSALQRQTMMDGVLAFFDLITGLPSENPESPPGRWNLSQNYPNPFNPSTTLLLTIPVEEFVTVRIYDLLGREVQTLMHGNQMPGSFVLTWDASAFPSGTYIARLNAGPTVLSRKLLLVK